MTLDSSFVGLDISASSSSHCPAPGLPSDEISISSAPSPSARHWTGRWSRARRSRRRPSTGCRAGRLVARHRRRCTSPHCRASTRCSARTARCRARRRARLVHRRGDKGGRGGHRDRRRNGRRHRLRDGGGLLRDVLADEVPQVFRRSRLYVIPALLGSLIVGLAWEFDLEDPVTEAGGAITVITLRLLALRYGWHAPLLNAAPPELRAQQHAPSRRCRLCDVCAALVDLAMAESIAFRPTSTSVTTTTTPRS